MMNKSKPDPYCKGCKYIAKTGGMWGCDYIFEVGHSRPCDPGKGCTARETRKKGRKKKWPIEE